MPLVLEHIELSSCSVQWGVAGVQSEGGGRAGNRTWTSDTGFPFLEVKPGERGRSPAKAHDLWHSALYQNMSKNGCDFYIPSE